MVIAAASMWLQQEGTQKPDVKAMTIMSTFNMPLVDAIQLDHMAVGTAGQFVLVTN